MVKIGIIVGSTRPGRFATQPANWLMQIAKKHSDTEFQLIDIEEYNLPLLDEPVPALMHQYSKDHTKKWSETIDNLDGFIMVSAEYNHSVAGALKNAIDFLNWEWSHKPVSFMSYGSQAGGARAVEHLRGIAGELKMYDIRDQVLLSNYWNDMNESGQFQFTEDHEAQATAMINELVYWSKIMKPAREGLRK